MQTKLPLPIGGLYAEDASDKVIPIYGVDEIPLESRSNWDVNTVGVQDPMLAIWQGDDVRGYNFNFELTAGVQGSEVFPRTREDLAKYMRWIHAWNAHQGESGSVKAPPAVRLVLGDYINQRGILKNVRTIAKPPWGGAASGQGGAVSAAFPTSCLFSGEFIFLPGYDASKGLIDVTVQTRLLNREKIEESFFKG